MSTEAQCKICHKQINFTGGNPLWEHDDMRIDCQHRAVPEDEEVTHPSQTRNFMSVERATELGYKIGYVSASEIRLTKDGNEVKTFWHFQFQGYDPSLGCSIVQEAIAIYEDLEKSKSAISSGSHPYSDTSSTRTEQLRTEIRNIVDRYGEESDLTVCEVLGVLELVKAEKIDQLRRYESPKN